MPQWVLGMLCCRRCHPLDEKLNRSWFPSAKAEIPTWLSLSGHLIIHLCNLLNVSLLLHLKLMCGERSGAKTVAMGHPCGCYTLVVEVSFPSSPKLFEYHNKVLCKCFSLFKTHHPTVQSTDKPVSLSTKHVVDGMTPSLCSQRPPQTPISVQTHRYVYAKTEREPQCPAWMTLSGWCTCLINNTHVSGCRMCLKQSAKA